MKHAIPLSRDFKNDSLLVINGNGKIRRLYTPFRVLAINSFHSVKKGSWVYVEKIGVNEKHQLTFEVDGEGYLHDLFRIYINF